MGCSGDSVEAQAKFKAKYKLNFPLLADTEFEVIEAYGARRMKSFFGKTCLGIVRSTFWIGPDGKIRKIWPKVTVKGHAAEVLARSRQFATRGLNPPAAPPSLAAVDSAKSRQDAIPTRQAAHSRHAKSPCWLDERVVDQARAPTRAATSA